jgi:hypothetical protein
MPNLIHQYRIGMNLMSNAAATAGMIPTPCAHAISGEMSTKFLKLKDASSAILMDGLNLKGSIGNVQNNHHEAVDVVFRISPAFLVRESGCAVLSIGNVPVAFTTIFE